MSSAKIPIRPRPENSSQREMLPVTYGRDESAPTFTVGQYQQMIKAGVFGENDHVELLEHFLVKKMSRNHPHDNSIACMLYALLKVIPAGWHVRSQVTLELAASQPEPDFMVLRGQPREYRGRHPGAADLGLVIEVAETSLLRDQRDKSRIYAAAGIPEYWIVNLVDQRVEAHSGPGATAEIPAYATVRLFGPGEMIPLTLGGAMIAELPVGELLVDLPPDAGTGPVAG